MGLLGPLLVLGGAVLLGVLARRELRQDTEVWRVRLAAMADDRSSAIDRWLGDNLSNAARVADFPTVVALAGAPLGTVGAAESRGAREHVGNLLNVEIAVSGYRLAALIDRTGCVLAGAGAAREFGPGCRALAARCLAASRPLADLHRHGDGQPLVQFAAPVEGAAGGAPVGVVVLEADPVAWLYPFLRHEPAPSSTAETVLVRQDGSDAVFLSPLRHRADAPLTLRRPLPAAGLAAAAALAGRQEVAEYTDYRGEPALAAARHLRNAPWGLVTKVDRSEIVRGFRRWLAGAAAIWLALAAAVTGLGFGMRQRHRAIVRDAITAEQHRLAELVHNANDAAFVIAMDGRVVQANRRAEEMYGYSQDGLRHLTVGDLRAPGEREAAPAVFADALRRDGMIVETVHCRHDGSEFPVEVSSRHSEVNGERYLIATVRDITAHREAAAALRQSEAQFRAMFETASVGMAQADTTTGRWLRVNRRMCEITGYAADELLAMRVPEITHPDDRQADWDAFQRVVRGKVPNYRLEKRYLRKDGTVAWVNINMTVIRDGEGNPLRTVATIEDITERRQTEQEREVTMHLLRVLNSADTLPELIREVTLLLRDWLGCEAVGVRLREGDDFPYFETRGFPAEFVEAESSLCSRAPDGRVRRDSHGNPVLECMCGNVISERFDPAKPFFTARGTFWTNSTTRLLATTTEADRQARTRNRCNGEGYESVALVALRVGEVPLGLVQVNDPRPDLFTPGRIALLERLADNLAVGIAHRQGLQRLAASEERYRFLFTNMLEGYAHCRMVFEDGVPVDFVYLDVNAAFESLTGLKDVIGRRVTEIIPGIRESNADLFDVYGRVALTGEPAKLETFVPSLSMWFSISVYSPAREHFVAVFDVVTERKRTEAALRESQELFATAFNNNPAWLTIVDMETDRTLAVNDAWCQVFGFAREEAVGRTVMELGIYDAATYGRILEELEARGSVHDVEVALPTRRSGTRVQLVSRERIRAGGSPYLLAMGVDITDRKRAEEELRARQDEVATVNERLQDLIEAVQALASARSLDDVAAVVRRSARRLVGSDGATFVLRESGYCRYVDEDAIGPLWKGQSFPLTTCISGWAMLNKTPAVVPDIYVDGRIPVDAYRPTFVKSLAMVPIRTEDPLGAIGTYWASSHVATDMEVQLVQTLADAAARAIENVGLLKDLEDRVHERTESLSAANRELEAFSYSVSHDLRAPLRAIDGFSRILQDDYGAHLDAEGQRLIRVIRDSTQRMAQLIEDLLAFSRAGRTELSGARIEMQRLVKVVLGEVVREEEWDRYEFEIADLPAATGDAALVQQVWLNLLGNAVKFAAARERPVVRVFATREDGMVRYHVRDNGVGFNMAYVDKLFGVFQRLHSAREFPGTGVGLALVRRIVSRHGGTTSAQGAVGEGAEFTFTLPAAAEERS
ncbi:MAG TPA: PAS domain S-box protein [Thermoanaerobaculaceae bacterium]|nr:PAS domain S-box protein [Thermoanaerobaculaceae bacterium]